MVVGVGICAGADADAGVVDAFARGAAFGEGDGVVDLCGGWRVFETAFATWETDGQGDDYDQQDDGGCDGNYDAFSSPAPQAAAATSVLIVALFFRPSIFVELSLLVH